MKRIVVCLDGTWNFKASRRSDTNVAKLAELVRPADDQGVRQIAHYIEGIASTPSERAQFVRGAIGLGVSARVDKAFGALSASYEPGDDVFLFGFSRGAFEARRLSGFISLFGIAKPGVDFPFSKAWEIYRQKESKREQAAIAELRSLAYFPVRIKCLGIWDTVGNLGNPFFSSGLLGRRYKLANTHPVQEIEIGLHALSIDEARGPFRPTLWTLPEGQSLPPHQQIEQVWFAGTHCDIGGGFSQTALSDIALRWMVERTSATTGLAFDADKLARMTRPDPLGAQHSSTTGAIFFWSGLFPFVRLVKQAVEAIPRWRRNLFGSWRSGKLPKGEVSINETIHDSVAKRYGQRVIELSGTSARTITYRPANLVSVLGEPPTAAVAQKPAGAPRRVKIYTVHGTFAHEAEWDNWLDNDDESAADDSRAFVHRLRLRLRAQGIEFDKLDHSQYEWSGGNSHEERRMAAVGLKKHIEADLNETYRKYGRDYYDGVYVIGHSHGGTVARLAMNLWDKDYDYYEPADEKEFVHDDKCMTCMRARHGKVGPSKVPRPDGVITFGSPFVRFEPRRGGLLTAKIGVWVYRALFVIPLLALFGFWFSGLLPPQVVDGATQLPPPGDAPVRNIIFALLWPIALYWALGRILPTLILRRVERRFGNGELFFAVSSALLILRIAILALVIIYYVAYIGGGPLAVDRYLPFLDDPTLIGWLKVLVPIALVWLLIVTLPSKFLTWIEHKVLKLRDLLPRKFDPSEDRPVSYLSYHTLGDEAGLHLRIFGALTWLVQTLGLTAACVLAMGLILTPIIAIEAINHYAFDGSLLSRIGISALSEDPNLRDRFVTLMDVLTLYPSAVWSGVFGVETNMMLSNTTDARAVAPYVPGALAGAIWVVFLFLMPFIIMAIMLLYLTSMWLRGSGVVFGSESMAWTMANRITVTRRANDNTMLRFLFISPEAWRKQEMAHCYYYKSARVIDDVASFITDWSRHRPSTWLNLEHWVGYIARWMFVLLFCLTIFAVAVPIAQHMYSPTLATTEGSAKQPPAEALDTSGCVAEPISVSGTFRSDLYDQKDVILRYEWEKKAIETYASEWTHLANAKDRSTVCLMGTDCTLDAKPCKATPAAANDPETEVNGDNVCRLAWQSVTLQRPYRSGMTTDEETREQEETKALARPLWEKEVSEKLGAEWAQWDLTSASLMCDKLPGNDFKTCDVTARPCKPNVAANPPAGTPIETAPAPATPAAPSELPAQPGRAP